MKRIAVYNNVIIIIDAAGKEENNRYGIVLNKKPYDITIYSKENHIHGNS